MTADRASQVGMCLGAALLIIATLWLPLWTMTLDAPQYPQGLYMRAYGSYVTGDLREINIINHYVGMEEIPEVPAPEMRLFPLAIWTLVLLAAASPFSRLANRAGLAGTVLMPIVTLADLQWWLHTFGQNLDPTAPLRFIEPFTPLALGISKIGNFRSTAMVSYGFFAWGVAAVLLYFALKRWRDTPGTVRASGLSPATAVVVALALATAATAPAEPAPRNLQAMIDSAAPGSVLQVPAGTYAGPIDIEGPLTVEGSGAATIHGDGLGSVVNVSGDGVTVRGLTIRRSGRDVSVEAAGIKATGNGHVFEDNRIEDVYFGIHLADSRDVVVRGNVILPGLRDAVRPGHAVSLWYVHGALIEGNRIDDARDGIYLSFADDVQVVDNQVTGSRYAVHSMYSKRSTIIGNHLETNLVGTALMYSSGLEMRCNRIERHRTGATAYAILLKDIDDLVLVNNRLVGNRVGIYADNTPLGRDRVALVRDNLIAGNEAALVLQSTVRLTFTGNQVVGNLLSVRPEGGRLSTENRWSVDRRGNYWDEYQGFDRDADGVGDIPYRYDAFMHQLVARQPILQAFLFTPAHSAIESAARLFPLLERQPLIVDQFPLMDPTPWACGEVIT